MDRRTNPEDVQATFVATLVDEWARAGLRAAVVCPGSRSTPLALALADHPDVTVQVQHDERSGGFLALGLALGSGRPTVVLTTSGTAAAELHPAVVEARHAAVPLLVCTADRPPELRDVGAPQTIDQTHLYGRTVRWFADPGVAEPATAGRWRAFAARAWLEAAGPPTGPVHLNLPFREPLVGTPQPLPEPRSDGRWTTFRLPAEHDALGVVEGLTGAAWGGRRGVILDGDLTGGSSADVIQVAEALGWPVVADPRSGSWGAQSAAVVPHLDGILRSARAREALRPEVILRLGGAPASRVVNEWCAASGAEEIVVPGPGWSGASWSDPAGTAAAIVREGHPGAALRHLARELGMAGPGAVKPVPGWLEAWRTAAEAASAAAQATLPELPVPNEPGVVHDVVAALPAGARLVVSSSMPIRDVERYATPRPGLRMLANRGANGIDGVVSTAVGVAAGLAADEQATGRAVTGLLIGDLAFLHDSNGLLGLAQRDVDLVCVVVDNDGGGIFSFLPQARRLPGDRFETLFGTPHGLDLVALARAYGVPARTVTGSGDDTVGDAVAATGAEGGPHVLVVRTDRAANVEAHRLLDEAIAGAVEDALADDAGP